MVDFEWLQACMLAFYPEFEAAIDPSPEVVFLMDLSNSMKGDAFRDSRKVYLLSIYWYLSIYTCTCMIITITCSWSSMHWTWRFVCGMVL